MATRWDNAVGAARVMMYPDMAENDAKSLTYTTPPLEEDVAVVGHPVVTLHVTSDTGDADFTGVGCYIIGAAGSDARCDPDQQCRSRENNAQNGSGYDNFLSGHWGTGGGCGWQTKASATA